MTESDKVREYLALFNCPDEMLLMIGDILFWETKTQGTDVVLVTPERRVQNKGTLWIKPEELQ